MGKRIGLKKKAVVVVGGAGFTDSFDLKIAIAEAASPAPTDDAAFALALSQADTVAAQTEAASLGISGTGVDDSTATPTDDRSVTLRAWLSASAGTGVTTPANANGSNDATNATIATALAGASTETMTSTLGANIPSGLVVVSAIYRGWFNLSVTLPTSTGRIIARSTSALFVDITMLSSSSSVNHAGGTFTFDLIAAGVNTLAKLQSLQILHETQDAVAGVTPASMAVDAGAAEIVSTSI